MTEEGTFSKLAADETPLYGPPKFLLCGFARAAARRFTAVASGAGLAAVPKVWVETGQAASTLAALLQLPDGTGAGRPSHLPRAVIVSGIPQAGLARLLTLWRRAGGEGVLWAVLTPVSETWTVERLLAELEREHRALRPRRR